MKTILVVEDDSALQRMYRLGLEKAGFAVVTVRSVDEAWMHINQNKPNLILLDIMLAGDKNGFDLLEDLKRREEDKDIPVILLTNLDSEEKTAREIGAADYLVKANLSLDTLIARVTESAS